MNRIEKYAIGITFLLTTGCTTMQINADGSCEITTPRTMVVQCWQSTIATGKVALSDESIIAIAKEVKDVIK